MTTHRTGGYTHEELTTFPHDPTDYSSGYYLGNPLIKRAGTKTQWTEELLREYIRCKDDIEYFARKYVKIINLDKGKMNIDPYPYQIKMWEAFQKHRFNIVLAARQSGKSIAYVVYVLHKAIFSSDHTFAILANKGSTAREILSRVQLALESLPFFLQPGCKSYNKGSIVFDTDTKIFASSTSASSVRGFSINTLLLDEFAFVENDSEFMAGTYPVISSGSTTQVIMVSTANGIGNEFHKTWEKAIHKKNSYNPIRVDWWDVPGRDEKWKQETIANTSERQFAQEFGNNFLSTSNTLISADKIMQLVPKDPLYTREEGSLRLYEEPVEGHKYVVTVDVGKGRAQDFSTFSVFDVTEMPYRQVCVYQNNMVSPLIYPSIIYKWATAYNEAMVVVEANDSGQVVANELYYTLEYPQMFVSNSLKSNGIGIEVTKKVKAIGCMTCKDLIEQNKLIPQDIESIHEFLTFVVDGSTWNAADNAHDDLVQNFWLLSWFIKTPWFADFTKDSVSLAKAVWGERLEAIERDLPPFGIVDNGVSSGLPPGVSAQDVEWAKQLGWSL